MSPHPSPAYQLKTSVLLFIILTVYILFISIAFGHWLHNNQIHMSLTTAIIASQALTFLIPFICYMTIKKLSLHQILHLKPLDLKNFLLIVLITLITLPMAMFISGFTAMFFDNTVANILIPAVDTYQLIMLVIAIGVTPAVLEEIIFRGIFYRNLDQLPQPISALMGGLFFGIVHWNLQQFSYAFALGILFAYFVHYTQSIWAPVLSHFLINSFNVVMIYVVTHVLQPMLEAYDDIGSLDQAQPEWAGVITLGIFSIILLPCFIFLMRMLKSRNQQ